MNDLFSPPIPAENILSDRFRIHAVTGDGMEPILRGGRDYVIAAPVDAYQGEGIYLLDIGAGIDLFRVSPTMDKGLCLSRENPLYTKHIVDRDKFNERVMGIVVADIRTRDERFLRQG